MKNKKKHYWVLGEKATATKCAFGISFMEKFIKSRLNSQGHITYLNFTEYILLTNLTMQLITSIVDKLLLVIHALNRWALKSRFWKLQFETNFIILTWISVGLRLNWLHVLAGKTMVLLSYYAAKSQCMKLSMWKYYWSMPMLTAELTVFIPSDLTLWLCFSTNRMSNEWSSCVYIMKLLCSEKNINLQHFHYK